MTQIGRRTVVVSGLSVASAAVWNASEWGPASATARSVTRSAYTQALGSVFVGTIDGRRHRLRLTSVKDHRGHEGDEDRFTLIFASLDDLTSAEGIYTLSHGRIPTHLLGLSRIDERDYLQAVVNRVG